ncbi:MAG: type II CRISPR RNA-guided endonuclease Cas9 [Clostridiales bacterium]|jgi:CRISPR-associated endonuclease Csn1|nr:type II CRISPR RNA-guided endonuclease Cas9 [Clostridiales bacterium]
MSYTLSLDIGTTSVGWAVIDDNFKLAQGRKIISETENGKTTKRRIKTNLWGVRLFEEGSTAVERRIKRGMRRRIERRKKRLGYLKEIFASHILPMDESFFIRLGESFYQNEERKFKLEKNIKGKLQYPLLGNIGMTDAEFYKKYPTIYHLRNELITNTEKADLRLVYLAMHHILKYRGHFINQGQKFNLSNLHVTEDLKRLLEAFSEINPFYFEDSWIDAADEILFNRNFSKSKKAYELSEALKTTDTQVKALLTAIVGNVIDLAKIFGKEEYKPDDVNSFTNGRDFKYSREDFDEKLAAIESVIDSVEYEVLTIGKQVYEAMVLCGILTKETLSASMVEKYEEHKRQLKSLKKLIRDNVPKLYDSFFNEGGIYDAYINGVGNPSKLTSREDFYKAVKKEFEKIGFSESAQDFLKEIYEEMDFERYLPKQRMSDNAAIPYQIHEHELMKIIENQGKYYAFLNDKAATEIEDENGEFEKIEQNKIQTLFKFRIPYYVGTLAFKHSEFAKHAWVVRKSDETLTPWNFGEIIDKEKSSSSFIERMTNFDTYLPHEKVLPKNSLLYQEFAVYNELINCGYFESGNKKIYFSSDIRQSIAEKLFKQNKKVSAIKLKEFINHEHNISVENVKQFFGIDTVVKSPAFNASYSTYIDLKNAGISDEMIAQHKSKFEQIIKWQTIFEDKKILKKTINCANRDEWNGFLSEPQIKRLANKHYTGWGRLSEKLLNGIKTSGGKTIIEELKTGEYNNFMRLLEDSEIASQIKEAQLEDIAGDTLNYELVKSLAGSPALKRGIWQSLKVIKELEVYLGRDKINRIVIEMARDNSGGRTKPRKKQIESMYENFKISKEIKQEFEAQNEKSFSDEKVFLYFLQHGKCMYSEKPLCLSDLSSYEVDHIIPQTYIKDDSFDNKVLVRKEENQNKGGDVPSQRIIDKMSAYWEMLAKSGLVSLRKLANLKTGKLTDKVKEGFINRQLVETRQITKHVANILTNYFNDTEIEVLTPKSGLTSQFREGVVYIPANEFDFENGDNYEYDGFHFKNGEETHCKYSNSKFIKFHFHEGFKKNRDINDYHHAHDAYLNAVVANYLYQTRPDLKEYWVYGKYKSKMHKTEGKYVGQRKNFDKQLLTNMAEETWRVVDVTNGEILTQWQRDEVLEMVARTLGYRNVNIVRKTETPTGSLFKVSNFKKGTGTLVRSNTMPIERYGGVNADSTNITVLRRDKKGKLKALSVPLTEKNNFEYEQSDIIVDKYRLFITKSGYLRYLTAPKESQKATQYTGNIEIRELLSFAEKCGLGVSKKINDETYVKFEGLTDEEKDKVLKDLLKLVSRGTSRGMTSLSLIGLPSDVRYTSADDTISDNAILINQSPTGLYETRKRI